MMMREAAAADRAGCVVVASRDPRHVTVACPSGWDAARYLAELAAGDLDPSDPRGAKLLALGRALRAAHANDRDFVRAVHGFVTRFVRFLPEEGERFQHPAFTLATAVGDCDCHARLVVGLLRAGGLHARLAFFAPPRASGPLHVASQALAGGRWVWVETTIEGARVGEHPVTAAIRTGVVREDVSPDYSEVVFMGDQSFEIAAGTTYGITGRVLAPDEPDPLAVAIAALEAEGFATPFDVYRLGDDEGSGIPVSVTATYPSGEHRELPAELGAFVIDELEELGAPPAIEAPLVAPDEAETQPTIGDVADDLPPIEIVHTRDLPDAFFVAVKKIARDLGAKPEWLLAIMANESGINPASHYWHPPDLATGLIGIVGLRGLGFNRDSDELENHKAFAKLSALEQLPYCARFWAPMRGRIASAATLYQYNFIPASLARGTSSAVVICAKDGTGYNGQEARFYELNKGLDVNGDGAITVDDLARILKTKMATPRVTEAIERVKRAPDPKSLPAILIPILALGGWALHQLFRGA